MKPSASVTSPGRPRQASGPAELARSLSAESAKVEALLQILREEQQALLERDFERVYAYALAKNEHLAHLGALNDARAATLRMQGLSPDLAGMKALVAGNEPLRHPWERLLSLTAEARQINLVNGRLIDAQMRFTEGALVALTQRTAARFATYGADGQRHSQPPQHTLASA